MTEYQLIVVLVIADIYGALILTAEYFFGRPDISIKNEAKQKKRLRETKTFVELPQGDSK